MSLQDKAKEKGVEQYPFINHFPFDRHSKEREGFEKGYISGYTDAGQMRAVELLKKVAFYLGGWREAVAMVEELSGNPARLENMMAAIDQMDNVKKEIVGYLDETATPERLFTLEEMKSAMDYYYGYGNPTKYTIPPDEYFKTKFGIDLSEQVK